MTVKPYDKFDARLFMARYQNFYGNHLDVKTMRIMRHIRTMITSGEGYLLDEDWDHINHYFGTRYAAVIHETGTWGDIADTLVQATEIVRFMLFVETLPQTKEEE